MPDENIDVSKMTPAEQAKSWEAIRADVIARQSTERAARDKVTLEKMASDYKNAPVPEMTDSQKYEQGWADVKKAASARKAENNK